MCEIHHRRYYGLDEILRFTALVRNKCRPGASRVDGNKLSILCYSVRLWESSMNMEDANSYLLNLLDLTIKGRIRLSHTEKNDDDKKCSIRIVFTAFNLTSDEINILSGFAYKNG